MPTDDELLGAWRAGDQRAGRDLVNRYFPKVNRFFRNKVSIGVEDLVQQTFLACVQGRDRFRGEGSFRGWIFGIARNVFLAHIRGKHGETDSAIKSAYDLHPSPSSIIVARDEERLMLEGLRRIPLDSQIALEMYFWEEMTGPEIAAALDVPEGTVRNRLRRGRIALEEQVRGLANSPAMASSTVEHLDDWAASIRAKVGGATDDEAGGSSESEH